MDYNIVHKKIKPKWSILLLQKPPAAKKQLGVSISTVPLLSHLNLSQ